MTVGNNIKKARGNMKQAELAEILDVDISTVSRWENDKNVPNSKMLKKIADALKTSTNFLLADTGANLQIIANEMQNENENNKINKTKISNPQNNDILFFKDGEYEISVPNTKENRKEFWAVIKQLFKDEAKIGVNIRAHEFNSSVGEIKNSN